MAFASRYDSHRARRRAVTEPGGPPGPARSRVTVSTVVELKQVEYADDRNKSDQIQH